MKFDKKKQCSHKFIKYNHQRSDLVRRKGERFVHFSRADCVGGVLVVFE